MNHKDYSRTTSSYKNITHQQSSMDIEDKKPMGVLRSFFLGKKMYIEILLIILILPVYVVIFVIYFRFQSIIKAMTEANDIIADLIFKTDNPAAQNDINKRDFLLKKVKNGESIANSKTPWTVKRLEKASDKVVHKLYKKNVIIKVNKQEALEMEKPVCPVVIEMYTEGLKTLVDQMPYIKGRYIINSEKLKINISTNKLFCDNLAIKIGSKMIEQMGENSATRVGVSLAAMIWDALEKREEEVEVGDSSENEKDE